MKKRALITIVAALLLACIILSLTCCKKKEPSPAPPEDTQDEQIPPEGGEDVPSPPSLPEGYIAWEMQENCSYGEPQRITYPSTLTGTQRHATIVLPHGYDGEKRYPVLYLLHGLNCDDTSWTSDIYGMPMNAHIIAANAHFFFGAPEMIIVCVNSLINADESQPAWTSPELTRTYDLTGKELTQCLMPYINSVYSTLTDRENTAIAGFSMGGREAVLTAFDYQDLFGSVGAFSSASFGDNVISASAYVPEFTLTGEPFEYVQVTCGMLDTLLGVSANLKSALEKAGLSVTYSTPLGLHSPGVWRTALDEFVKNIFMD